MKGSMKQINWAEELKAQAMTVLKWARDNYPTDDKDGDEQTWKENLTGLMMCLDRVESASYIIDAFKDGAPYACTMKDMGRIASIIKIWIINNTRYPVITVPTQDEIRAELAAEETSEEAAPVEESEEAEYDVAAMCAEEFAKAAIASAESGNLKSAQLNADWAADAARHTPAPCARKSAEEAARAVGKAKNKNKEA